MMTYEEVMTALKSLGTEQNVRIYKRHGMGNNIFGVSIADLARLRKRIGVDHNLAQELWHSGNGDARHLATMIADPSLCTEEQLERWAGDLTDNCQADVFVGNVVRKTPFVQRKFELWTRANHEFKERAGWDLLAVLAMNHDELTNPWFEKQIARIEKNIHKSKNFVRHAMNGALIAIGLRNAGLEKRALAAARRIGKVLVNHGETSCKTPDAAAYIQKAKAHYAKRRKAKGKR